MILESATHELKGPPRHEFDLFINAAGYEERACSLVRSDCVMSKSFLSLLFPNHRVLEFGNNIKCMKDRSATLIEDPVEFFRNHFEEFTADAGGKIGRKLRVGVDVSSMNRTMAATVLSANFAHRAMIESLDLFYVPSKFAQPKLSFSPIQQIGPVIPEFSGFDSEPALPLALVLGLGFEYGTAVGIINQLEPQTTICFKAVGHDLRFEEAVRRANLDFDFGTYNVRISEYDLLDVYSAYRHIENIVHSLLGNFRIVMVPMGPKIFAGLLFLIALRYFGQISVWRVARPTDEPVSVQPDTIYLAASVDISCHPGSVEFEQLKLMLTGKESF